MTDQTVKKRVRRTVKSPPASNSHSAVELTESLENELARATPPRLKKADKMRQRKKLQVMKELDSFRASFSRGYQIILAELAEKHRFSGENAVDPNGLRPEEKPPE